MSQRLRTWAALFIVVCLASLAAPSAAAPAASPTVTSATVGSLPFFASVTVSNVTPSQIVSVAFSVKPKPNTVSSSIAATYSNSYLMAEDLFNSLAGTVTIPIFGLYENFVNTVTIKVRGISKIATLSTPISTSLWSDPAAAPYRTPTVNVARQKTAVLSYSFFMMKNWSTASAPLILDTDGYVRWAGAFSYPDVELASTLWGTDVWVGRPYTGQIYRQSLTGSTPELVSDLSLGPDNVIHFHHNMLVTSKGLLVEVNTTTQVETVVLVLDSAGQVVKTFNLGEILSAYLVANGEDPSSWMNQYDWFHANSSTYWPARNELVVSSRENFVIGLDYDTSEIKWIMGDTTKQWYLAYPSLRPLALTLSPGTLAPFGQHSVSIDSKGNLMLFNNGLYGYNTSPAGQLRSYSTASTYTIDSDAMTATMVWNYDHGQDIFSPITSSVYQDNGKSILLDYSSIGPLPPFPGPQQVARVIGLTNMSTTKVAFDYSYVGGYPMGWNAFPVHLESVTF